MQRTLVSALALVTSTAAPTIAHAQVEEAATVDQGGGEQGGVAEIVVTAQKRAENVQDVPIAITALTANSLSEKGINNVADIAASAPNTTLKSTAPFSGSSSILVAFIRGIGQNDFNFNLDPGVGVYLDGVYIARNIGTNSDLLDLDRIEVLKGPQGTLFGRNTIGGAINIVTRDPSNDFTYKGEITTGRYNRIDVRGSVDAPLVDDKLLTSFSFATKHRDGWQRHVPYPGAGGFVTDDYRDYPSLAQTRYGGARSGNENQDIFRAKVLVKPTDNLKIVLSGDYMRTNEQATPSTLLGVVPDNPTTIIGLYNACISLPQAVIDSLQLTAACGPRGNLESPTGVLSGLSGVNMDANPTNNRSPYSNAFVTGDPDVTYGAGPNFSKITNYGLSSTIGLDIADDVSLKSITAYRHLKAAYGADNGGAPFNVLSTTFADNQKQFSEELQLVGKALDQRWDFVFGAYYFHEYGSHDDAVNFVGGLVQVNSPNNTYDTKAYALYTHNNFFVTDRFKITLGGRFTWENKSFTSGQRDENIIGLKVGLPGALYPDQSNPPTSYARLYPLGTFKQSFNNFSWRAGLDYKLTNDTMVYASFANGFKSGGWSTRLTLPVGNVAPTFGPEKAETYEAGIKTTLFDRRLRLNAATFQTDYKDIQLVVQIGTSPTFVNGGTGRIRGFEVEMQAVPVDGLSIDGSLGYLLARYLYVSPAAQGITTTSRFPNAPELTAHLGASYELKVGEGAIVPRADWSYVSRIHTNAENTPLLVQSGYSTVDGSLTYRLPGDRFELQAGVKNIFDKRVLVSGFTNDTIAGGSGQGAIIVGNYNRPREWFLTFRIKG